jgi:hypothetical protein
LNLHEAEICQGEDNSLMRASDIRRGQAVLIDGKLFVVTTGLSWSKMNCRTLEDARCLFRTMTHASRFAVYRDIDELNDLIDTMPPYQKPGILPEQLSGIPARLPRLNRA